MHGPVNIRLKLLAVCLTVMTFNASPQGGGSGNEVLRAIFGHKTENLEGR